MGTELRKKYLLLGAGLLAACALSLLIRLDFSNASLLLRELRLPRLLLGLAVGAGLSVSGLVLQTVLSNPLAEPYTLGIASGAALGAAIETSLSWKPGLWGLNPGAILGAALVILVLLRMVSRGTRGQEAIVLIGVMVSLTAASLLAIWMALADPLGVQSVTFWLLGDLSRAGLSVAVVLFLAVSGVAVWFWIISKKLDAFLFGEEWVEGFGVSLPRTRSVSIVLVSIVVGLCVSAAGVIGFVGLVVPHLIRRWTGAQRHFHLVPLCFMGGAVLLTLSDSIARGAGEPRELPVGAVTALLGAPAFIALFVRSKRGEIS
ncbi:MAG: iron ABC transporter permease [Proteobacteria bacterium]|nr:iron ABC transporter permease [Pseudomonadota bacterium]